MQSSNNNSLVSIVLTTYNGEKYLREQIDSLLAQIYSNIEILALDDRSIDNTWPILQEYDAKFPNFHAIQNECNLGYVKNFEKGCRLATGEFIAFADQDDYWLPNKIQRFIDEIGAFPFIYADSEIVDRHLQSLNLKISDKVGCKTITDCIEYSIYGNVYGHTVMLRKSLFDKYSQFPMCVPHDWYLSFAASLEGGAKYLPEVLHLYRQHETNVFGIIGGKAKKSFQENTKQAEIQRSRDRIALWYDMCPAENKSAKSLLKKLCNCYSSFSLIHDFQRFGLFLLHRKKFLILRKKSEMHKFFFCFKMLVKIK